MREAVPAAVMIESIMQNEWDHARLVTAHSKRHRRERGSNTKVSVGLKRAAKIQETLQG